MDNPLVEAAKKSAGSLWGLLSALEQEKEQRLIDDNLAEVIEWALKSSRLDILRTLERYPYTATKLTQYLATNHSDLLGNAIEFSQPVHRFITQQRNKADLTQRIPDQLDPKQLPLQSSGREVTLIDPKAYNEFRRMMIEKKMKGDHSYINYYTHSPLTNTPLKYPIMIGDNGEMIALMSQDKLGEGGFGTVYHGMDVDTSKFVAIKKVSVKPGQQQKDIDIEIANLSNAGRAVSTLTRQGTNNKTETYIVDEFGWGKTYFDTQNDFNEAENINPELKKKNDQERRQMSTALLQAVHQLHHVEYVDDNGKQQNGIIHRDLKGLNVIWDPQQKRTFIVDFGKSKPKGAPDERNFSTTLLYLAPESTGDNPILSEASDVFACGVMLLELYAKGDLFKNVTAVSWYYRLNAKPDTIREHFEKHFVNVPPEMQSLIRGMLEMDPEKRMTMPQALAQLEALDPVIYTNFWNKLESGQSIELSDAELLNPDVRELIYSSIAEPTFLSWLTPASFPKLAQALVNDKKLDLLIPVLQHVQTPKGLIEQVNQSDGLMHLLAGAAKNDDIAGLNGIKPFIDWNEFMFWALASDDSVLKEKMQSSTFFELLFSDFNQRLGESPELMRVFKERTGNQSNNPVESNYVDGAFESPDVVTTPGYVSATTGTQPRAGYADIEVERAPASYVNDRATKTLSLMSQIEDFKIGYPTKFRDFLILNFQESNDTIAKNIEKALVQHYKDNGFQKVGLREKEALLALLQIIKPHLPDGKLSKELEKVKDNMPRSVTAALHSAQKKLKSVLPTEAKAQEKENLSHRNKY